MEKEGTNMRRKKTRMDPMVLDWNWRYQCKLMIFNINGYRDIEKHINANLSLYMHANKILLKDTFASMFEI